MNTPKQSATSIATTGITEPTNITTCSGYGHDLVQQNYTNKYQLVTVLDVKLTPPPESSIEIIYKSSFPLMGMIGGITPYSFGIFKDIYKCVDGELKLTETLQAEIIPATEESYQF